MKWYEIIVTTTTEGSELVADAFFSIGCQSGVKIIDSSDILSIIKQQNSWDYIDESLLMQSSIVKVSGFVSQQEKDIKVQELTQLLQQYGITYGEITTELIDDENWQENWKKHYKPIVAGKYVVVPRWLTYKDDGLIQILIEPGMAFGTGEHESTKMCLQLMSELSFDNKNVIDIGTGSGILGIAAIKSNAKSCYMCDIDSLAVDAAMQNAKLNNVENKAEIELNDLLSNKGKVADIILANLTADILIRLSSQIGDHISSGGNIVCSGIIHQRKSEVINAFLQANFELKKAITLGEWNALIFGY